MSLVNLAGLASFNPCLITSLASEIKSDNFFNMNTLLLHFTFGAMKGKDL